MQKSFWWWHNLIIDQSIDDLINQSIYQAFLQHCWQWFQCFVLQKKQIIEFSTWPSFQTMIVRIGKSDTVLQTAETFVLYFLQVDQ